MNRLMTSSHMHMQERVRLQAPTFMDRLVTSSHMHMRATVSVVSTHLHEQAGVLFQERGQVDVHRLRVDGLWRT